MSTPLRAATVGSMTVVDTPRYALVMVLPFCNCSTIGLAVSTAIAKPMFCASCDPAELMPTTSPSSVSSGPPELPGLIAASVCTRWVKCSPSLVSIVRSSADTIPSVAVGPPVNAKALPIATTGSPMRSSDDLPNGNAVRPVLSTLMTARSSVRSTPSTLADADVPSEKATSILVASATTWALVAISPSLEITNPVPAPWPPLSATLMLTTPGSALLIKSETSVFTAGPDDAEVVSKPRLAAGADAAGVLVLVASWPAMAPPTVPPAMATVASVASANRRRPWRGDGEALRGGSRSETGDDPAGAGQDCSSGVVLGSN